MIDKSLVLLESTKSPNKPTECVRRCKSVKHTHVLVKCNPQYSDWTQSEKVNWSANEWKKTQATQTDDDLGDNEYDYVYR